MFDQLADPLAYLLGRLVLFAFHAGGVRIHGFGGSLDGIQFDSYRIGAIGHKLAEDVLELVESAVAVLGGDDESAFLKKVA